VHLFRAEIHTLATGETQVCRVVRAAGFAQGTVPTVHDDFEQCGLGEGVVLPPT
jgi:hypothetical protein